MRRTITTLALAAAMLLLSVPAAVATHGENSQDTAGAGTLECRPGADNDIVHPWLLTDMDGFVDEIADLRGITDPDALEDLRNGVQATWDFCDKNRDGYLCVMRYTFMNGGLSWNLLDNRPFGG
jgi:hypothetical protein